MSDKFIAQVCGAAYWGGLIIIEYISMMFRRGNYKGGVNHEN